jgi:hypothetical protein
MTPSINLVRMRPLTDGVCINCSPGLTTIKILSFQRACVLAMRVQMRPSRTGRNFRYRFTRLSLLCAREKADASNNCCCPAKTQCAHFSFKKLPGSSTRLGFGPAVGAASKQHPRCRIHLGRVGSMASRSWFSPQHSIDPAAGVLNV